MNFPHITIHNTQDDDNDQVLLMVEQGGANPMELELKSTDVKVYDENVISPKARRDLRVKYGEALFAGMSAGNIIPAMRLNLIDFYRRIKPNSPISSCSCRTFNYQRQPDNQR